MSQIIRSQGHQRNIVTRTMDLVPTCQTCHCWTSVIFSFRKVLTKIRGDHVVNDICAVSAEKHHAGIKRQWVMARSTRCSREKHHLNAWSLNGNVSFLCLVLVSGLNKTSCSVHKGHQSMKPWSVGLESFRGEDDFWKQVSSVVWLLCSVLEKRLIY